MARTGRRLSRAFFRRDPLVVAPELLGTVLVRGPLRARIVEVEAYHGAQDPGSHAFRGMTPRNATMFGPPGHLYVYFTYGMHWCANAVCGPPGEGVAVLLRAAAPEAGLEVMRVRRPAARRDRDLCRGPARLCQAFAIDRSHDGADLVTASHGITIVDDGEGSNPVATSTRIGLRHGADLEWRFYVDANPYVSRP
jgi:DNA-3-methyladenine glycosylase